MRCRVRTAGLSPVHFQTREQNGQLPLLQPLLLRGNFLHSTRYLNNHPTFQNGHSMSHSHRQSLGVPLPSSSPSLGVIAFNIFLTIWSVMRDIQVCKPAVHCSQAWMPRESRLAQADLSCSQWATEHQSDMACARHTLGLYWFCHPSHSTQSYHVSSDPMWFSWLMYPSDSQGKQTVHSGWDTSKMACFQEWGTEGQEPREQCRDLGQYQSCCPQTLGVGEGSATGVWNERIMQRGALESRSGRRDTTS